MKRFYFRNSILLTLAVLNYFSINLYAEVKKVDVAKSFVEWKGTKVTGEHVGKMMFKSGELDIADKKIVGGKFVVDMNSLSVGDLDGEYKTKFLNHMKSEDFFVVSKYPEASFVIKKVTADTLEGDLTIKDKTNPVVVKYKGSDKSFSGELEFDRTKFDMKYGSGSFFKDLGDKMIHDKVTLKIMIEL